MATASIGPIGLLHRERVRVAAFQYGIETRESRGLLDSTFSLRGPATAIERLRAFVRRIAEEEARSNHRYFVDAMERSERRRHFWGRMFGRGRRTTPLTRDESAKALDMMEAATEQHLHMSDEARDRLAKSISRVNKINRAGVHDDTVSTITSIAFRYLQRDLRTGEVKLAKPFMRQVLSMRVTIDTWDD